MAIPSRNALKLATENLGKRADLELLLSAIRDDREAATHAYATWRERYPVDDIDIHAMKLVPRLVMRLRELGIEDGETKRLDGIGKYLLLQGHVMMEGAREAADWLGRAGVQTIAIKGVMMREAGLVTAYERPMVDADLVLVRPSAFLEAASILKKRDWKEDPPLEHATTFKKGRAELDLHKIAVRQDRQFGGVVQFSGTAPYALIDLTSALIITCLHGLRTDGGALWVFDAEALVKKAINWDAVLAYADSRKLVLALATALRRVRGVPDNVMQVLDAMPASHIEALELRHLTTPFDRHGDRAARLLGRLRERGPVVDVRVHEHEPGLRWDPRWEKEWR